MANYNTNHLEREIDSLRKQLIKERDERRYDDSLLVTTTIKQAEERTLERCIVECMEEANTPTYTEDERIAILTATERLKEMRNERVKMREEQERVKMKEYQQSLYAQAMAQSMKQTGVGIQTAIDRAMISGTNATHIWMDDIGVAK